MVQKEKRQKRFFLLILLLSLLLHIVFLLLPLSIIPRKEPEKAPIIVERIILPEDKGRVVDQIAEANKEKPTDSKYLSEFDNKVERETKAPLVAEPHKAPKPTPPQIARKGTEAKKKKQEQTVSVLAFNIHLNQIRKNERLFLVTFFSAFKTFIAAKEILSSSAICDWLNLGFIFDNSS